MCDMIHDPLLYLWGFLLLRNRVTLELPFGKKYDGKLYILDGDMIFQVIFLELQRREGHPRGCLVDK